MFCDANKKPDAANQNCVPWPVSGETGFIDNCQEYSVKLPVATCVRCINANILNMTDNNCTAVRTHLDSDCTEYHTTEDICITCDSGFELSPDRQVCLKNDNNCKTYYTGSAFQKNCFKCKMGYYFDGTDCIAQAITNCRLLARNINECEICESGYELTASKTCDSAIDARCTKYDFNSKCIQCTGQDKLVNSVCSNGVVDNCTRWNDDYSKCLECSAGYYSDGSGVCQSDANCSVFNYNGCNTCNNGYFLNTSTKICDAITVSSCTTNYTNFDSCQECAANKYPNKTSDNPTPSITCSDQSGTNCSAFDTASNMNKCTTCSSGLLVNDGYKCIIFDLAAMNCATYDYANMVCTACTDYTYQIFEGNCYKKYQKYCVTYTSSYLENKCMTCDIPFEADGNGECKLPIVENCATMDPANDLICQECSAGYYAQNGKCYPQRVEYCSTYTANTNTCTACQSGFYLDGGACIEILNCQTLTAGGDSCDVCNPEYCPDSGTPNLCVHLEGCSTCTSNSTTSCDVCMDYYYKDGTICTPNPDLNCKIYDSVTPTCTECRPGYDYQNPQCLELNDYFCKTLDGNQHCQDCYDFQLQYIVIIDGQCNLRTVFGCLEYKQDEDKCTKCDTTKYLSNGQCLAIPSQCKGIIKNASDETQYSCSFCSSGYYVDSNNKCVAYTVPTQCVPESYEKTTSIDKCYDCNATFGLFNNACYTLPSATDCSGLLISQVNGQDITKTYCYYNSCDASTQYYDDTGRQCVNKTTTDDPNCSLSEYVLNTTFDQHCLVCATDYLPNSTFVCQEIAGLSGDCSKFRPHSLDCLSCDINNKLWSDNYTCQDKIANCLHQDVTYSSNSYQYVCQMCDTDYYLFENACYQYDNSLTNCSLYFVLSNTPTFGCLICSTNTILYDNQCYPLPTGCQVGTLSTIPPSISTTTTGDATEFTCTQCSSGYVLINAICYSVTTITNCHTHTYTAPGNSLTATCTQCDVPPADDEYLLTNNTCVLGSAQNDNCENGERNEGATITCNECKENYFIDAVKACHLYDTATGITNGETFWHYDETDTAVKPLYCNDTHFFANKSCTVYSFQDQNYCKYFNLTTDECSVCKQEQLQEGVVCKEIPYIERCEWYETITKCKLCAPDNYFVSSPTPICEAVPANELITGCIYYDESKQCTQCDINQNYEVFRGTCIDLVANNNCLQFFDDRAIQMGCKICASGFVSTPQFNYQCVSKSILHDPTFCAKKCSDMSLPFCQQHCQHHASCESTNLKLDSKCSLCQSTFFLQSDQITCLSNTSSDNICLDSKIEEKCLVCKDGFSLKNGFCVEDNSASYNCIGTPCLFCLPGYMMNDSFTCTAVSGDKKMDEFVTGPLPQYFLTHFTG